MSNILSILSMAPGIQNIPDPDFDNVELLLHGDGTNGSTTILDSSSNNVTVTAFGSAQIDTATKQYGTGSIEMGASNYLTTATNAWTQLSTGDFTIECWVYLNSLNSQQVIMDARASNQLVPWQFKIDTSNKFVFSYFDTESLTKQLTGLTTLTTGQWYHLAAARASGTLRIFVDGVQDGSVSVTGNISGGSTAPYIGRVRDSNSSNLLGFIDDFRSTIGVARYTGNFTPPTRAFPDR